MRRSIEQLAYDLSDDLDDNGITLGQLAEKHGESIPRIMDALDVWKIVHGMPTQVPPIIWGEGSESPKTT